jgi:hypothetical protein
MIKPNAFDITVKAAGIDIRRKVDESVGSRIVSIILGREESGKHDIDLHPPSQQGGAIFRTTQS